MALSILDGNQSATTLSTIVTSGQHIPAHTVVSIGTQAITDISGAISGSTVCVGNLGLLQSTVATEGLSASGSFIKIGGHTGTSTTGNIVHVSAVGALRVDGSVYTQPVSIASVTIGNTVTIAGTVTANPTGTQTIAGTVTAMAGTNFANEIYNGIFNFSENDQMGVYVTDALPTGSNNIGRVTIGGGTVTIGAGTAQIGSVTASISGTVPISISSVTVGNSVTIGSLPAISGTVTANLDPNASVIASQIETGIQSYAADLANDPLPISGTVTANLRSDLYDAPNDQYLNRSALHIFNGDWNYPVGEVNPLPISGTVTANSSNGSLTTRFGSVTTANTAFVTSAVTNANRKYLLIQNITTASNVVTVGIGFTPTTTQGIQLFAGAGLTFEGSYIPTGAVNLLSSVTASCYTILEA